MRILWNRTSSTFHSMDITHSMSILLSGEELSPSAHFLYTDGRQQMKS